jgi:hypothetical protein
MPRALPLDGGAAAYHDPANPGVAFLVKPHDLARYPLALFPLAGLLLVARAIRAWLKRAPPKGPTSEPAAAAESGIVFLHA